MDQTTALFMQKCVDFRLLSSAQLQEAVDQWKQISSDEEMAEELLKRRWLTAYQIRELLAGRGASLNVGPYVLLDPLGRGGMGEVFKARHRTGKHLVALKVIDQERIRKPTMLRRFAREIEAVRSLFHPNVVQAFDDGQDDLRHYLAMEYVEGINLIQVLRRQGSFPVGLASDCVRQSALALQHIHERGLVHRDIKPSNLLLTAELHIKVVDLGVARLKPTSEDEEGWLSTLTNEGTLLGTVNYLAPEQASDAHDVDIRADIYSLGCTLYHLLTGAPPFPAGTTMDKILKHKTQDPIAVEFVRTGLPAGLGQVVRKMMAKRPTSRYQQPAEVAEALEPFCTLPLPFMTEVLPDPSEPISEYESDISGEATAPTRAEPPPDDGTRAQ
jgi:serine/threonine protein kinase